MDKEKVLIACEVFADELQACLGSDRSIEVRWIPTGLHADLNRLEREILRNLEALDPEKTDVCLLYGSGCHPEVCRFTRRFGAGVAPVKNCIEAFCGPDAKRLEENRTLVLTPGWVRGWPAIMEALGWDAVDVRIHLGRYDRILILEPGVNPLTDEEILTFFDLVQVPVEVQPLDLSRFRATVDQVLEKRVCSSERPPACTASASESPSSSAT